MRYLVTVVALGLCTSVSAQSVVLDTDSSVTTRSTIESNTSSVTSSVDANTGVVTNSIIGRTGSMCSAVVEGMRCEISCRAPQVAQCGKGLTTAEPTCMCK
jgi:hypothetical protein